MTVFTKSETQDSVILVDNAMGYQADHLGFGYPTQDGLFDPVDYLGNLDNGLIGNMDSSIPKLQEITPKDDPPAKHPSLQKPEHEDSKAKRRGPMDEMRQLVRIMVKFLPQSLIFLHDDKPGGGNRVREPQVKAYLKATLGDEAPQPDWGVPQGWGAYLADLFTWALRRQISDDEARSCACRQQGRSWQVKEARLAELGLFTYAWPLPLTQEGVAEAQLNPGIAPVGSHIIGPSADKPSMKSVAAQKKTAVAGINSRAQVPAHVYIATAPMVSMPMGGHLPVRDCIPMGGHLPVRDCIPVPPSDFCAAPAPAEGPCGSTCIQQAKDREAAILNNALMCLDAAETERYATGKRPSDAILLLADMILSKVHSIYGSRFAPIPQAAVPASLLISGNNPAAHTSPTTANPLNTYGPAPAMLLINPGSPASVPNPDAGTCSSSKIVAGLQGVSPIMPRAAPVLTSSQHHPAKVVAGKGVASKKNPFFPTNPKVDSIPAAMSQPKGKGEGDVMAIASKVDKAPAAVPNVAGGRKRRRTTVAPEVDKEQAVVRSKTRRSGRGKAK